MWTCGWKGFCYWGLTGVTALLYADDAVLLVSMDQDLQHTPEYFSIECEASGMGISTSQSRAMVLSPKRVDSSLHVGVESLPSVRQLNLVSCSQVMVLGGS